MTRQRPVVAISQQDFEQFRDFFVRKTGIQFDGSKRYFVDRRLAERIDATASSSFDAYFGKLRTAAGGEELQHLTNAMTVNETYFFREAHHFECLVNSMLPECAARVQGARPLRVWVVPSSSGEEPYSIAIYLLEQWAALAHVDVEILASDIDTSILAAAEAGRFSARSVQLLSPELRRRYFERVGDAYQISDELRGAVRFSRVNVTDPVDTARFRDCDVIFCRNLLFYFDEAARRRATQAFHDALAPGGFVCLGQSDAMGRANSRFVTRRFPDAVVYQRPLDAEVSR